MDSRRGGALQCTVEEKNPIPKKKKKTTNPAEHDIECMQVRGGAGWVTKQVGRDLGLAVAHTMLTSHLQSS